MRAAVVGGGIFGCTAAVELARAGVDVDLFECRPDLLLGASRANQGRLHAGYHYPRSLSTARELYGAVLSFGARFPGALRTDNHHHYLVAKDSRTPAAHYLAFCDQVGLVYSETNSPLVRRGTVDLTIRTVFESFVDLPVLRGILRAELLDAKVNLHFNAPVEPEGLTGGYDWVVDATYGRNMGRPLRFELCEIALIRLGRKFTGQSFVVMDGPFVSLDPLVGTDLHMLYDVVHSVHHVSDSPDDIPPEYANLVDQGPTFTDLTNVDLMEQTARRFLSGMGMPEYRGSMFTVRAVLPDVDDTDERPTMVERDGNLITVFSGKIATAVTAARRVLALARPGVLVP